MAIINDLDDKLIYFRNATSIFSLHMAIINDLDDKFDVFWKSYQIGTLNIWERAWKLVKFSLATLIVTCQTRVALRSLSNENGV
jgi:hypothetical protein